MPESTASAPNAPKKTSASPVSKNAVTRCSNAWERAFAGAMKKTNNEYKAQVIAEEAFYDALPIPIGHGGISAFIACIAFAIVHDIIRQEKATRLLYAAQVALKSDRRKPGPKKSAAKRE